MAKLAKSPKKVITSKKEMRIAICGDVIKSLRARIPKFNVSNGHGYIDSRYMYEPRVPIGETLEISKILPKIQQDCYVCALGALLLTEVKLNNECYLTTYDSLGTKLNNEIRPRLSKHFSQRQLQMIEGAFEGNSGGKFGYVGDRTCTKLQLFYNKYPNDPRKRMIAICQNIIDNDGVFVP